MAEGNRTRGKHGVINVGLAKAEFINPYPWMSSIEAMVHLALEEHKVPFSWRLFDGVSPNFTQLLGNTGYQPEFTLEPYKAVILVQGGFFGTLPGVVDQVALAKTTLEADGYKVVILWDTDIRTFGAWNLLIKEIPSLGTIQGPEHVNPYVTPNLMNHRNLHPRRQIDGSIKEIRDRSNGVKRRNRRNSHRIGDSGRVRIGVTGAVSGRTKVE